MQNLALRYLILKNKSLVDLIVKLSDDINKTSGDEKDKKREAVSETIENNIRKVIIEESQTNPKYFEKMSRLLDEIIRLRKEETLDYQDYLEKIKDLGSKVSEPSSGETYPIQ